MGKFKQIEYIKASLAKYKPQLLFVTRLLILFLALDYFFIFYIGVTAEGGGLYSRFLADHLNFVFFFRQMLLEGASFLLWVFGHETSIEGAKLRMAGGGGVIVNYSCYGFSVISLFTAFIVSFKSKINRKIKYLALGIVAIIALNVLRIGGLLWIYSTISPKLIRDIDHHLIFNIIIYLFVFYLFRLYLKEIDWTPKKSPTPKTTA